VVELGTRAKSAGRKMKIKTVDRNGGSPTSNGGGGGGGTHNTNEHDNAAINSGYNIEMLLTATDGLTTVSDIQALSAGLWVADMGATVNSTLHEAGFDIKSMQKTNEVNTVGNGTHEAAKGVENMYMVWQPTKMWKRFWSDGLD
jgi:hypothetical protein